MTNTVNRKARVARDCGISMPQIKALKLARKEGYVYAGYNHSGGARISVSWTTIASCEKRGWLTIERPTGSPPFGRVTDAGASLPCLGEAR